MSRSGTTFLYHNLQKHPDIFLPVKKETGYFGHNYEKGLDWYKSFYKEMKSEKVAFDICGLYFFDDKSIEKILEFNPNAKVILGIRNPKEWIYSLYEQYRSAYDIPMFSEFINGCQFKRDGKFIELDFKNNNIKNTIERFQQAFGENLLLFDFELLKEDPLYLLNSIERFANVDQYFEKDNFTNKKINARDRLKVKFFNKLLLNKTFADLIIKLVPRSVLLKVRNFVEKVNILNVKKSKKTEPASKYTEKEKLLVDKLFEEDFLYYKNLFKDSKIVYGKK